MTITYGFYDSISSDRLYNAKQMGSIFDGLILDGVYGGYGDVLATIEDTGMDISVGSGRAWFDHTWTYNDAAIGKTIATADALLNRIDVVYLEVNETVGVRANSIGVLEGTPASSPAVPELTNTSSIHQYALAHIYVGAGVTEIVQANITNMVGTEDTPYVTILVESEDLQAQVWAIVGDIYPPLIDLIELKAHNHDGSPTVQLTVSGLANDAVETVKIKNSHVTAIKLAADSVITSKILNGNVTADKLATDAVIAGKIADDGVVAGNIADDGVVAGNIANNAVEAGQIAPNAVIAGKIADNAVAANEIVNNVVDDSKIGARVPILPRRQGDHATDWNVPGTTNRTPQSIKIQVGAAHMPTADGLGKSTLTVTVPVAFTGKPVVIASLNMSDHFGNVNVYVVSSTQFILKTFGHGAAETAEVHWIAIGAL
jgi:hypothetical protein